MQGPHGATSCAGIDVLKYYFRAIKQLCTVTGKWVEIYKENLFSAENSLLSLIGQMVYQNE